MSRAYAEWANIVTVLQPGRGSVGVGVVLVVVLSVTGCSLSGSGQSETSATRAVPTAQGRAAASRPDDGKGAEDAVKRLETDAASVVASGARDLVTDVSTAFPAGTKVAVRKDSWAPDGTGTGGALQLTVTYPGQASRDYLAVMIKEGGTWKVLATVEAGP